MAVIQISKIQHRRGAVTDLPRGTVENPTGLSDGELGFTNDTGELYIGSPNVPEVQSRKPSADNPSGKFPYGNTQVLTEWSRNAEELIAYQYRYRNAVDNTSFPGPGSSLDWAHDLALPWDSENTPVSRRLQERLDEMVSVKSYGAVGDGVTDDTYAIWRAALDVTQETTINTVDGIKQVGHRRALYFPSGVYHISRPLILPTGSNWYGDGIGKTIIKLTTASGDFRSACVVETIDNGLTLEDLMENFNKQVPEHLPRTEYQIGTGIPNSPTNGELPTNIFVTGMEFQHRGSSIAYPGRDVIRLLRSSRTVWLNCRFSGSNFSDGKYHATYGQNVNVTTINQGTGLTSTTYNADNGTNTNPDSIGVFIDGLGDIVDPSDHVFSNCQFNNTTYAFSMTDQVQNVVIDGCTFDTHYRAISIGEEINNNPSVGISPGLHTIPGPLLPGQYGGPSGIRITNCHFQNILSEAIFVQNGLNILSNGNVFLDSIGRGSGFNVANAITTPVMYFGEKSRYCSSVGDFFARPVTQSETPTEYRILFNPLSQHLVINWQDTPSIPRHVTRKMFLDITTAATQTTGLSLPLVPDFGYVLEYCLMNDSQTNMPRQFGELTVLSIVDEADINASIVTLADTIRARYLTTGVTFGYILSGTNIVLTVNNTSSLSYRMVFRVKYLPMM